MPATFDVQSAVADALKGIDTDGDPVEETVKMSGGAAGVLDRLSELLDRDRGEVLSEAVRVLFLGVTLQKEGLLMAFVDPDGSVQTSLDLISKD